MVMCKKEMKTHDWGFGMKTFMIDGKRKTWESLCQDLHANDSIH